jgi:alkylation response protein AidB-like acyl-CoA dehydrogenase
MDLTYSAADEAFREEVRTWLAEHLVGEFAELGTGLELGERHELELRKAWERELSSGGWVGLTWPAEYGGREATLTQEIIFNEEYVKAGGPNRMSFFGEGLLGPTLMAFGNDEQKKRFLPKILSSEEFWCQGFSEPDAGSDLANIKTTAYLDGDEWVINGQKVWTSLGHVADWIFVVCRTEQGTEKKHQGLSFLLAPVDQPGIEMRPIEQITGTAEFNEVFFTDARTTADLVVGEVGQGWRVTMGTLGFERGSAFIAQQMRFYRDFNNLVELCRERGIADDPVVRQRLATAFIGLEQIRMNNDRITATLIAGRHPGPEAAVGKLQWSHWHRDFGELCMDLLGPAGQVLTGGVVGNMQYAYLFSRAETIFAGASEIQRNIISERVLGMPR